MTLVRYARLYPEIAGVSGGAYGTRPTTPTNTDIRVFEEEVKLNQGYEYDRDIQNRIWPTVRLARGKLGEGPIRLFLRPDECAQLLLTHFGKVTTADVTGAYTHLFSYQDDPTATMPSVGIDLGLETLREKRLSGVAADTVKISVVPQANEVGVEYGLVCEDAAGAAFASFSPSYSMVNPWYGADKLTCTLDSNPVVFDNLTITMKRGIKKDAWRHGARTLQDIEMGPAEVTVEGDLKFTTAQYLNDFLSENYHTFDFVLRGALITGAHYYDLTIDADKLGYTEDPGPHINRQERMIQNLKLTANYTASTNTWNFTTKDASALPATYP